MPLTPLPPRPHPACSRYLHDLKHHVSVALCYASLFCSRCFLRSQSLTSENKKCTVTCIDLSDEIILREHIYSIRGNSWCRSLTTLRLVRCSRQQVPRCDRKKRSHGSEIPAHLIPSWTQQSTAPFHHLFFFYCRKDRLNGSVTVKGPKARWNVLTSWATLVRLTRISFC